MQRLKTAVKKIAALGVGAAMLGATMTGALAADLTDYPAPFIVDGVYSSNNVFVIGRNAKAEDNIALANVVKDFQLRSKICVPGVAGGSVSVSGDAVEVSDPSDLFELREALGNVRETLTEVELDGLRGGLVTTSEGTTEFNQYLRFQTTSLANLTAPVVNFTENDAPTSEIGDYLIVREGSGPQGAFFEYELEFEDGLESDIVSNSLDDFEDEELVILGNTYTFVETRIDTTANSIVLELLGGAEYAILEEGEVRTFTIDGKEYEVEVLIIEDVTPATATFKINGEVTDQLIQGETEILRDGTLIGISDIILNEAGEAGAGDLVELFVGASKLEIKDTEYTNSESTDATNFGFIQGVTIDEEQIEDAWIQVRGNEISTTEFEVFSIKYRLIADALPGEKDLFVAAGHGIREFLDEPQGMLGFDWDVRYEGLDDVGVSLIKLDPSGDDEYNMELENRQGKVYRFPFITNEGGTFKFGDRDDDFVFVEGAVNATSMFNASVGRQDYFILSDHGDDTDGLDSTSISHIVRYNSIDTTDTQLQFDDLATGNKEFVYRDAAIIGSLGRADLIFGGNTYLTHIVNLSANNASSDSPLAIDMDNDGSIDSREIRFTINGGGIIDFMGPHADTTVDVFSANFSAGVEVIEDTQTGTGVWTIASGSALDLATVSTVVNVTITTLSEDFDENSPPTTGQSTSVNEDLNFGINQRAGSRIGVNTTAVAWSSNGGFALVQADEDDDHYYGMTDYGSFVDIFDPEGTDDAETVTIEYPLVQRGARVFIVMGETSTTKTTAGEVCSISEITPDYKFDDEVNTNWLAGVNAVLVGGPCINDAVEMVEGLLTCDEFRTNYAAGDSVIQLVDNGENVAMLVAGYNADDTMMASKKLGSDTLSGELVEA